MPTVNIDGVDYEVYEDTDAIDEYLNAAAHGASWRDLTDDDEKGRYAVTASRLLDRQLWKGDATGLSGQTLAWPRTGTGVTGVEDDVIPDPIYSAYFELCLALVDGSTVQTDQNTAQKAQSLSAGSVSITYFRGAEGDPLRFPLIVQELLNPYLAGTGQSLGGALASGTDGFSVTDNDFGFGGGF
jgi:hypothetical protein